MKPPTSALTAMVPCSRHDLPHCWSDWSPQARSLRGPSLLQACQWFSDSLTHPVPAAHLRIEQMQVLPIAALSSNALATCRRCEPRAESYDSDPQSRCCNSQCRINSGFCEDPDCAISRFAVANDLVDFIGDSQKHIPLCTFDKMSPERDQTFLSTPDNATSRSTSKRTAWRFGPRSVIA